MLVFGGTRTYHRIATAIGKAGFEIKDCIMWIYGSGFPKSMNIGLAIDKKLGVESTVVGQNEQILQKQAKDLREGHRKIVDSFNAGASERNNGFETVSADVKIPTSELAQRWKGWGTTLKPAYEPIIVARKPVENHNNDDVLKVSRYYYCAKASKSDRDEGLDEFEEKVDCDRNPELQSANVLMNWSNNARKNIHPTVKPTELMQYLVRLVTPKDGTVLDPFMGSGSTGKATILENKNRNMNYKFIGIEMSEEYYQIASARIKYVASSDVVDKIIINEGDNIKVLQYKQKMLF